ncbi:hypothetical protein P167DRAFT_303463 [Morchella conica CCBAS932]|uniref:Uncharacterized protein n=1 Tax=Morchella conica CCBAS932 TaxID=1392247 RepID=A0A3N4KFS9_9PEZI|nr:hypothetical protein P167DRAFT_303463 [Morchella conica CCBAS932]
MWYHSSALSHCVVCLRPFTSLPAQLRSGWIGYCALALSVTYVYTLTSRSFREYPTLAACGYGATERVYSKDSSRAHSEWRLMDYHSMIGSMSDG